MLSFKTSSYLLFKLYLSIHSLQTQAVPLFSLGIKSINPLGTVTLVHQQSLLCLQLLSLPHIGHILSISPIFISHPSLKLTISNNCSFILFITHIDKLYYVFRGDYLARNRFIYGS